MACGERYGAGARLNRRIEISQKTIRVVIAVQMRNHMQRVQYYSDHDMSIGYQFNRIKEIFAKNWDESINDINDVIELYSAFLILKTPVCTQSFDITDRQTLDKKERILPLVNRYFSKLDNATFLSDVPKLENNYRQFFWYLFEKNKCYLNVSEDAFQKAVMESQSLSLILRNKNTVDQYKNSIRYILIYMQSSWLLFLRHYLEKRNDKKKLLFDRVLSDKDKEYIVESFVNSDIEDSTLLKLISDSKAIANVKISLHIRVKARKKYDEIIEKQFKSGPSYTETLKVSLGNIGSKISEIQKKRNGLSIIYNKKWLEKYQDYSTILNNFIYVFNLVDSQGRWNLITRESEKPTFMKVLLEHGQHEFYDKFMFEHKREWLSSSVFLYNKMLAQYNLKIEDVIRWFFECYLKDEFGIKNFAFNVPKGEHLDKIRSLLSELDSVLQQFNIYCQLGYVNRKILELDTDSLNIRRVSSLIANKYIYPTSKMRPLFNILFSDQSLLFYKPGQKSDTYSRPYERLINNESPTIDLVAQFERSNFEWLVENGFLSTEGRKIIYDRELLKLCWELYDWGYVDRRYLFNYSNQIKELKNKGMIEYSSPTLLSKQEIDVFNFIMNNSEYTNSLDIRNKYLHGNQSNNLSQINEDYNLILILVLLIVIKINEEFCHR